MNEHVHPTLRQVINTLAREQPVAAQDTSPDEEARVRADIQYQKNRERYRCERALDLQLRHQAYPGALP